MVARAPAVRTATLTLSILPSGPVPVRSGVTVLRSSENLYYIASHSLSPAQ